MKSIGIIPARLQSTRLPKKPLIKICDKYLIQYVYEKAKTSKLLDDVLIATDSEEILETVKSFNGQCVLTSKEHKSGTERIGEVIKKNPYFDIIINIQCDEPLIKGEHIDSMINELKTSNSDSEVITLMKTIDSISDLINKNLVKVITNKDSYAIYFSRFPIPYSRINHNVSNLPTICHQHIGIYGFKKNALIDFISWKPSAIEEAESLEQLRFLYYSYKIKCLNIEDNLIGIDTAEDLERFKRLICSQEQSNNYPR